MNIWQAIKHVDDATTIAMNYAPGYTAYISIAPGDAFETPDRYHIAFVNGMMPPHSAEQFDTADQVIAYLVGQGWADGWQVDDGEE